MRNLGTSIGSCGKVPVNPTDLSDVTVSAGFWLTAGGGRVLRGTPR